MELRKDPCPSIKSPGFNQLRLFSCVTVFDVVNCKDMNMATLQPFYTTREAGERLGVTDARIRQLCIEHKNIGNKHGNAWILTEVDIMKIQALPEFRKKVAS